MQLGGQKRLYKIYNSKKKCLGSNTQLWGHPVTVDRLRSKLYVDRICGNHICIQWYIVGWLGVFKTD